MPRKDPEERRAYQARWYQENRQRHINRVNANNRAKLNELKAEVKRLKEGTPCADCGKNYPYYVMDFDHVRGEKKMNIGKMNDAWAIRKELEKCEIVCSNCHRIRTHARKQHGALAQLERARD